MKYCLDTSALIDLGERHYPERIEVFAPIWEYLYNGIENGDIISVDYVKTELEQKAAEWRTNFLSRAGSMFIISNSIELEYANLIQEIESRNELSLNKQRERFMNGADPWVIALAKNIGECTVISAETKSLAYYGLGPLCSLLNVEHMNLVGFFEVNEIGV